MKPNLYKIFSVIGIFLLGALVGGAVAGYGTSYFLGKFMMHGSTLSEMVAIKSNVFTLTKLRAGNSAEAIDHLEMMLDGNLSYFSGGIHGTANEQKDIRKALKTAKEYRQQNPRSTKYPDIDNAVAAALSEVEK